MPQIWLTYDELGALSSRDGASAREAVIDQGWQRRRCHDGQTRVKLSAEATELYMAYRISDAEARRVADKQIDEMVAMLRAALGPARLRDRPLLQVSAA